MRRITLAQRPKLKFTVCLLTTEPLDLRQPISPVGSSQYGRLNLCKEGRQTKVKSKAINLGSMPVVAVRHKIGHLISRICPAGLLLRTAARKEFSDLLNV